MPIGDTFPEVLAAAQAGAEWAVTVLFRDKNPALFRYLRARAGDHGEDLASQVWLEVARGLTGFEGGEEQFVGWLYAIARRRYANWLRDTTRRRDLRAGVDAGAVIDVAAGRRFDQLEGDEAARLLVASLPPEQAEIVLLRVVVGMSVDEVAAVTGRKPGAVRVAQHRALERLAQMLTAPGTGEEKKKSAAPVTRRRRRGI